MSSKKKREKKLIRWIMFSAKGRLKSGLLNLARLNCKFVFELDYPMFWDIENKHF